jgi:predicted secreted hydrolase
MMTKPRLLAVAVLSMAAQLLADDLGWKSANPAYRLSLPADHACHPAHKIEWWYYTGNLQDSSARRFGYQLTFFRVGVDPAPSNPSRWTIRDLYMAHFAVTDVEGRRHRYADRMNRGGIGWAGADTRSYLVWNEDWLATLGPGGNHVLRARADGFAIALTLQPGKDLVKHGTNGYSQKGAQAGNASHYYSLTRMPTRGSLTLQGRTFQVGGDSWMDHEFGTSFLEPGQVGWVWFSLQLDDGSELMLYEMRRSDGARDSHSSGTIVEADGKTIHLSAADFLVRPADVRWRSPKTGATYPIGWTISVPSRSISLRVGTSVEDQELDTSHSTDVTYWEGAIEAAGTVSGHQASGHGYLEMTGYGGEPLSEMLR